MSEKLKEDLKMDEESIDFGELQKELNIKNIDLFGNYIKEIFKDCTVLTIAHRLTTIAHYEKALVLDRGELIEYDQTTKMFTNPSNSKTEDYITGRFG